VSRRGRVSRSASSALFALNDRVAPSGAARRDAEHAAPPSRRNHSWCSELSATRSTIHVADERDGTRRFGRPRETGRRRRRSPVSTLAAGATRQHACSRVAPAFEQLDKVGLAQRSLLLGRHPVSFECQPCERRVSQLDAASVAPAFDRAAADTGLRCSLRNRAASREHVGCCSDRFGVRARHTRVALSRNAPRFFSPRLCPPGLCPAEREGHPPVSRSVGRTRCCTPLARAASSRPRNSLRRCLRAGTASAHGHKRRSDR
jgi:hypothetical protein